MCGDVGCVRGDVGYVCADVGSKRMWMWWVKARVGWVANFHGDISLPVGR